MYSCHRASAPLQIVFVGVAVRERPDLDDKGTEYAVSVSDGSGTVQVRALPLAPVLAIDADELFSLQSEHNFRPKGENAHDALDYILDLARKYTEARGHKVRSTLSPLKKTSRSS